VLSIAVTTFTVISGCFQPGQAKVVMGPTPLGRTSSFMIEIREKGEGRYARQHVAISRQSCWGLKGAGHKVFTYVEYRAVSGVFQNIGPPPPLSHTRRAVRGVGVNILEDARARHWIGLFLRGWVILVAGGRKTYKEWAMACTPAFINGAGNIY
jgi:hypothetical protein